MAETKYKEFDKVYTAQEYQFLFDKLTSFYSSVDNFRFSRLLSYLYHYTKGEEISMGIMYSDEKPGKNASVSFKKSSSISEALSQENSFMFSCMYEKELDEMPLLVSNDLYDIRIISAWRMEIGK